MLEIMVHDDLILRVTIILGFKSIQDARLLSIFPSMVVAVKIQDSKITALTKRIVELQHSDEQQTAVQQLVSQRESLIIGLSYLACAGLESDIEKWRTWTDVILTLLFVVSTALYLWSVSVGLAVDAALVGLLWYSCRLYNDRINCVQELLWEVHNARQ